MNSITTAPAPAILPDTTPAAQARTNRRPWGKFLTGAFVAASVATGIGAYIHHAAGFETTDDAFVEGNVHPVSARISGTVVRVLVDDNAHVQAGDALAELDPTDLQLTVQGAEADLAQARAATSQVEAQVLRAQADLEAASARLSENAAQLTKAELDFKRAETLAGGRVQVISQQDFDAARATVDAMRASRQSLIAAQGAAEAARTAAQAQRAVALAQVQKAAATLATARLQVEYTVIRAATAGRVAKKSLEVGQRIQPGQPVMSLVSDRVWIVANFKESQLAHLRAGEKVEVRIDAIDDHRFQGVIESFSPGTGTKFSLLPPDNSTGNFTKVVQRVPVKILFTGVSLGDATARLAPGLSAFVKVAVRE
jgi:membrane fusion protein (multidrug efflux system)